MSSTTTSAPTSTTRVAPSRLERARTWVLSPSRPWLSIVSAVAAAYLLLVIANSVVNAVGNATDFAGYAADGPFQLYNPLRRLEAGEWVGRDFPFFHGAGVLVVHYPLFDLLGGNLFASEMSRWLMSPLFFLASGWALMLAALRDKRRALVALAVYTAIVYPMDRMVDPSNSLYGIRTTFPLLAAAAFLWRPRRSWRVGRFLTLDIPTALAYLCLGLAVSFGTEQGLAAIGAFLLVRFVRNLVSRRGFWSTVTQSVVDLGILVVLALLASTAFTAGHPVAALSYALQTVPLDQGWVFGAPPNVSFTWSSLLWELKGGPVFTPVGAVPRYWMLGLLACALVYLGIRIRRVPTSYAWTLAYLGIYGVAVLAAIIGYINFIDQMAPLARGAAAITGMSLVALAFRVPATDVHPPLSARPGRLSVVARLLGRDGTRTKALAGIAGLVVVVIIAVGVPGRIASIDKAQLGRSFSQALKGPWTSDYDILGPGWKTAYDSFAPYIEQPGVSVWSTYTSAYDSIIGEFNGSPGGEDYIIHALGPERREAYEQAFIDESPDYVITVNPAYFIYEEWLGSRWPRFYEYLYSHYEIAVRNGSHLLWKKRAGAPSELSAPESIAPTTVGGRTVYELPPNDTATTQLYQVTVDYTAEAHPAVLARLPRYLFIESGTGLTYPISLPPYETSWTFLVPVLPGQTAPTLRPTATGVVRDAELDVSSFSIQRMDVPSNTAKYFIYNYCFTSPDRQQRPECPYINRLLTP